MIVKPVEIKKEKRKKIVPCLRELCEWGNLAVCSYYYDYYGDDDCEKQHLCHIPDCDDEYCALGHLCKDNCNKRKKKCFYYHLCKDENCTKSYKKCWKIHRVLNSENGI